MEEFLKRTIARYRIAKGSDQNKRNLSKKPFIYMGLKV